MLGNPCSVTCRGKHYCKIYIPEVLRFTLAYLHGKILPLSSLAS